MSMYKKSKYYEISTSVSNIRMAIFKNQYAMK